MPLVKLLESVVGPGFRAKAGDVLEVDAVTAKSWIATGLADVALERTVPVEDHMARPQTEKAVTRARPR